jgi:hypothetical protein
VSREREGANPFNLAFLDIMFCGFGAVVLLVMIVNGKTLQKRDEIHSDLRVEIEQVTDQTREAQDRKQELIAQARELELQTNQVRAEADILRDSISGERERAREDADERSQIDKLKSRIEKLEEEAAKRGQAASVAAGDRSVAFDGEGRRQYLTGLKLGGDRTLILVDSSASMLDSRVVNVVVRKLQSASTRRSAPKWQRAVRTCHWLISNLQPDRQFQVIHFNEDVHPVLPGTEGRWLDSGDTELREASIRGVQDLSPENGTNLQKAFRAIAELHPGPDSVILLTDGLPTLGMSASRRNTVSGEEREELFRKAVRSLPSGVPVNTLLFPLEGDPAAAAAFWKLAYDTSGSFITPSSDWP